MLFMLLFIMLCLLDTSRTNQFHPGNDYLRLVNEYYKLPATFVSARLKDGRPQFQGEQLKSNQNSPQAVAPLPSSYQVPLAAAYTRLRQSPSQRQQPSYESQKQPTFITNTTIRPINRLTPLNTEANQLQQSDKRHNNQQQQVASSQAALTRIHRNVNPHKQSSPNPINSHEGANPQNQQQQQQQRQQRQRVRASSATNSAPTKRADQQDDQSLRGQLTVNQYQLNNQGQHYNHNHHTSNKLNNIGLAGAERSTTSTTTARGDHEEASSLAATESTLASAAGQQQVTSQANSDLGNGDSLAMASSLLAANNVAPGETLPEDPLLSVALLSSNLAAAESLDFVGNDLGGGGGALDHNGITSGVGGGHYDYAYQQQHQQQQTPSDRESPLALAAASQHYPSTQGNNSMALYRLLNLIEQSSRPQVPLHLTQAHISMPFQSSKISSSPYSSSGGDGGAGGGGNSLVRLSSSATSQGNFDNYNDYHHYHTLAGSSAPMAANNKSLFNGNNQMSLAGGGGGVNFTTSYHQNYPFATSQLYQQRQQQQQQASPSFMPNHWSRKRNQVNWRQQQQQQASDLNQGNGFSVASNQAAAKQPNGLFVDQYLIEVQPTAMKMIRPPSSTGSQSAGGAYLNTSSSPRRNNSAQSSAAAFHGHQQQQQRDERGHDGGHHNFSTGNLHLHSHSPTSTSTSSNYRNNLASLNNHSFNSLLNNDNDVGFGNKQPSSQHQHSQRQHESQPLNNSANSSNNVEKLSGALTSSSLANLKVPHDADSEIIAANNAPRCDKFTPDICVDDFEYPEQAIIDEIQKKRDVFELMYSEVKDNEPLVDGIPRDVEESYNYDYYYYGKTNLSQAASQQSSASVAAGLRLNSSPSPSQSSSQAPPKMHRSASGANYATSAPSTSSPPLASASATDTLDGSLAARASISSSTSLDAAASVSSASSSAAAATGIDGMDALIGTMPQATNPQASQSPPTTGYICPSEVMYGKPKLAKNKKGLWKVIVNAGEFTQTVRLEKCLFPNKKCNYVSAQSYESRCAQVHSYNRLLVFEKGRGFYIDTFRLPTGCNCYVSKKPFAASSSSSNSAGVSPASSRRDSTSSQDSSSSNDDSPLPLTPTRSSMPSNGRLPALLGDSSPTSSYNAGNQRDASSSSSARGPSSESMLSQTLWSILSGGGGGQSLGSTHALNSNTHQQQAYEPAASSDSQGGRGAYDSSSAHGQGGWSADGGGQAMQPTQLDQPQPQRPSAQREAYQSQSLILEHLSQNPALAANISDSVLRQLIDVGQISGGGGGGGNIYRGSNQAPHQQQQANYDHQHHHQQHYHGHNSRPPPLPPYKRR